jgi:hypothetical protein
MIGQKIKKKSAQNEGAAARSFCPGVGDTPFRFRRAAAADAGGRPSGSL